MKNGIDLSKHNTVVNYIAMCSKIDFAIIRAGFGKIASQEDKQFTIYKKQLDATHTPYGCYWYSYALSVADAIQEAKACITVLKKYNVNCQFPIFYDIEDNSQNKLSNSTISMMINAFCNELQKAGYTAGWYSFKSFIYTNIDISLIQPDFYVWYADCTASAHEDYTLTDKYTIHQYSFKGSVDGVLGNVDLDRCSDETFNHFVNAANEETDIQKYIKTHKVTAYDALCILKAVVDDE